MKYWFEQDRPAFKACGSVEGSRLEVFVEGGDLELNAAKVGRWMLCPGEQGASWC